MTAKQSAQLSKAEEVHARIVERHSLYKETAHWTPVLVDVKTLQANDKELTAWLRNRGLERGTPKARNDYLCPVTGLFLFKDPKIAMEFKLLWV